MRIPGLAAIACAIGAMLVSFYASPARAQTVDQARADIRATYDFEPSSMSFDEQSRRASALTGLWDRYSAHPEVYGVALRSELNAKGNRELLYCDGAMLLLSRSGAKADTSLGIASLRRCSLAQIEQTPYFYTMHELAVRGIDQLELQFRMLEKPKYSAFIVQHSLALGQDYAFLYPLLVRDESAYVPALIARWRRERDPVAQGSLVRALWYAATDDSESMVRRIAVDGTVPQPARNDARKLLEVSDAAKGWSAGDASFKQVLSALGLRAMPPESELRAKRRARMRSISDEALYDLDAYTTLIYRARGAKR